MVSHSGVDIVNGPVTAATECLRWTSVSESILTLLLIGLVTLIFAVALVPVEEAERRFGRRIDDHG